MTLTSFDTHQAVKAITKSGLDDTQAEAIVTTINNAMHQNFATKSDFVPLKADVAMLKTDVATLKADVAMLKTDVATLKADVAMLKTDVTTLMADVATLKVDVAAFKTDMGAVKGDLLVLKWMVGLIIAVEALPFLKILFA